MCESLNSTLSLKSFITEYSYHAPLSNINVHSHITTCYQFTTLTLLPCYFPVCQKQLCHMKCYKIPMLDLYVKLLQGPVSLRFRITVNSGGTSSCYDFLQKTYQLGVPPKSRKTLPQFMGPYPDLQ